MTSQPKLLIPLNCAWIFNLKLSHSYMVSLYSRDEGKEVKHVGGKLVRLSLDYSLICQNIYGELRLVILRR